MKVDKQELSLVIEGELWKKSTPREPEKLAEHIMNIIFPIINQLQLEIKELSPPKPKSEE